LDKLREEADELREAIAAGQSEAATEEELGDLLFATVNLARHLGIDPERALRRANDKFAARFRHIEHSLAARQRRLEDAGLEEMETLWQEAKRLDTGS